MCAHELLGLSSPEVAAIAGGYCRNPNSDKHWYPRGPGIWSLCYPLELWIDPEHDRPFASVAREYSTLREIVVHRFNTWAEFMRHCETYGRKSEPGRRHY